MLPLLSWSFSFLRGAVREQAEGATIGKKRNLFPWFEKFSYQKNLPTLNPRILGSTTRGRFNEVHELAQGLISVGCRSSVAGLITDYRLLIADD